MKLSLQELLKLSRDNGVLEMSAETEDAGWVKVVLAPSALGPDPEKPVAQLDEPPEPKPKDTRGKDGLTAAEQDELYMKRMSDTSIADD